MDELLQKAVALLARREHSVAELKRKLKPVASSDLVATVVENLTKEGLQSDARFVEGFIRSRVQLGAGPRRIEQELRQRGIDSVLIDKLLPEDEDYWFEHLQAVWQKKYHGSSPKTQKEKARQLRFLQARGFSVSLVMKLFGKNSTIYSE